MLSKKYIYFAECVCLPVCHLTCTLVMVSVTGLVASLLWLPNKSSSSLISKLVILLLADEVGVRVVLLSSSYIEYIHIYENNKGKIVMTQNFILYLLTHLTK